MKKILVVDFNGTSSVYTHYLSKGLIDKNNEVKILGKKKPEFLDVFENLNEYLGFKTRFKLLNYILNWCWLLTNYKKFDVVIIQWLQLLKYTSIEIKLLNYLQTRVKLIYVLHNLYPHNVKNNKVIKRYKQLYRTSKNIAVHTSKVKRIITELSPEANVLKVEHGFFFKEFRQETPKIKKKKCLMIGYISKYKGIEDALKVVKLLKEKNVIISLEIIGLGTPKYLNDLTKIIHNLKINNQVNILSKEVSTKFLIDKINQSTMLWLPYKKINQSGVSYTSIGLEKPFVGYDVGNFKTFFGDKGVAKIVEKDNVEAFSEGVIEIIKNEELYKENIQKNYRQHLKNLKIVETIPRVFGVFYVHDANGKVIYIGKGKNIKTVVNRLFLKETKRTQKIQDKVVSVSYDKTGNELFTRLKYESELDILSPKYNTRKKRKLTHLDFNHDDFIIIDKGREIEENAIILVEKNEVFGYGFTNLAFQETQLDILKFILTPLKNKELSKSIIKKFLQRNRVQKIIRF